MLTQVNQGIIVNTLKQTQRAPAMYYIKFNDNTWLTKPDLPYANYYSDGCNLKYDNTCAFVFESKIVAYLVARLLGKCKVVTKETPLRYEVGKTYYTNNGGKFFVVKSHDTLKGYETISNEKGQGRYNRSTNGWDNGRTTGSKLTGDCLEYPPREVI